MVRIWQVFGNFSDFQIPKQRRIPNAQRGKRSKHPRVFSNRLHLFASQSSQFNTWFLNQSVFNHHANQSRLVGTVQ
jgi:hypothetical protein